MSSNSATLDAVSKSSDQPASAVQPSTEGAVAGCPKCGNLDSWGRGSWCPKCGYYPLLGACVDVQPVPDFDAATGQQLSLVQRLSRIPQWARILAAGMLAVFVLNLAASLCLPKKGAPRAWFSFLELLAGSAVFLGAHTRSFIAALMKDSRFAPPDFLFKPVEIWRHTFQQLPDSTRRVWIGAWGFTAAFCALAVVGGLRYSALVDDWGFRKRAAQNLAQKIVAIANEQAEEISMEDALKETSNVDVSEVEGKKEESELEMLSAQCVIIGYTQRPGRTEFDELILASLVGQELCYVGTVSTGIPEDVRKEINSRLAQLPAEKPIVKCPRPGKWVQPKITCNVAFKSWGTNAQMQKAEFKEIMADMRTP